MAKVLLWQKTIKLDKKSFPVVKAKLTFTDGTTKTVDCTICDDFKDTIIDTGYDYPLMVELDLCEWFMKKVKDTKGITRKKLVIMRGKESAIEQAVFEEPNLDDFKDEPPFIEE